MSIGQTIFERKGKCSPQTFIFEENTDTLVCLQKGRATSGGYYSKGVDWFKEVFLPVGYPHTVSEDYFEYQTWDSAQAFFSHLSGALSLHSTLEGLGVGKESATAIAATLAWLIQDGTGMVSSIYFAYWKGSHLDTNSKQWRLFADIANDGAHLLKLLAPVLPFPFLATLCLASVFQSLVGVAGGATRASLIQHQAQCDNIGDLAAKDGSQETLVNLAGLFTSLTLLSWITFSPVLTWIVFLICVTAHLFANYKAMKALKMNRLNRPRLLEVLHHYVRRGGVLSVEEGNKSEPLFTGAAFNTVYLAPPFSAELGVSLAKLTKMCEKSKTENFSTLFTKQCTDLTTDKYMLFVNRDKCSLSVIFAESCDCWTQLLAFWSCFLLANNLNGESSLKDEFKIITTNKSTSEIVEITKARARETFPQLHSKLAKNGWSTSQLRFNVGEFTISFEDKKDN